MKHTHPLDQPQHADRIFAWIGTAPDGCEGIVAINGKFPLIATDLELARDLKDYAAGEAMKLKVHSVHLVAYNRAETIDFGEPG